MEYVSIDLDNDGDFQLVAEYPWLDEFGEDWNANGYRVELFGKPLELPEESLDALVNSHLDELIEAYKAAAPEQSSRNRACRSGMLGFHSF